MIYFILLVSTIFLQEFDLSSKSLSAISLKNNSFLNQNYANQASGYALDEKIDVNSYIVGPGDKFYLSFSANNYSFNNYLVISPIGDVIIPTIGLVNVNDLLLKDAYNIIINKCKSKYNNIDISITLSDMRTFYVNIHGINYGPSKVLVNPLNSVTDAFALIVSKIDNSKVLKISQRNIKLKRDDNFSSVDMLSYKIFGDSYNPTLKEGDQIFLSEFNKYIDVYGGIINPGKYEYVENEPLDKFILITGGFTQNSNKNSIEISRFDVYNKEYKVKINENYIEDIQLKPFDHINVLIDKNYRNRDLVFIGGEINTSGYYVIDKDMTFYDLLIKSGGYTFNADTSKLLINNKLLSNDDYELNRIMLIAPQKRSMSEISYLKSRSLVKKGVISSDNLYMTKQILNYKINPGDEVNIEGYSAIDYINEAGGKTIKAKNKLYLVNSFNQRQIISKKTTNIQNGETIFVQTKEDFNLWNKFQESMGLMGQLATLVAVLQSASK